MFPTAPGGGAPTTGSMRTTRSRRRQRSTTGDGSFAPPPKRQRSTLNDKTFVAPDDPRLARHPHPSPSPAASHYRQQSQSHVEPHHEHGDAEQMPNGKVDHHERPREVLKELATPPQREVVFRGKKAKVMDRAAKGDGSVLLTRNDTYAVNKLPALPDELRNDAPVRQRGAIFADSGYALSMTPTSAIVWSFASNTSPPETFVFSLNEGDAPPGALALGSLVSPAASASEPGLVIVAPDTGKITYWESITSASTVDFMRQHRKGITQTVQGLYSGETITQLVNAESAGFVLGCSSGRIAYMSVRDSQGRPGITVQFLRDVASSSKRGIFGSLRRVIGSSQWNSDVAAIRAGPQLKVGERDVVVTTTQGKTQAWTLHRGGHSNLRYEVSTWDLIMEAVRSLHTSLVAIPADALNVIDVTYMARTLQTDQPGDSKYWQDSLMMLVSLETTYYILELALTENRALVRNITPITCYASPMGKSSSFRPTLYLPRPMTLAFVVFSQAVVLISVRKAANTPSAQLLLENHTQNRGLEDVLDLRNDKNMQILAGGLEEPNTQVDGGTNTTRHRARHPALMLLVKGVGILRITLTDPSKLSTAGDTQITAQSKLEQAVYYGHVENTPLTFTVRSEMQFTSEEIGQAALRVSQDILCSKNPNIVATASMEQHLKRRAVLLRALASHLLKSKVDLDRVTRWRLLWDAEKLAAITVVWEHYDARMSSPEGKQDPELINEILNFIHENMKTEPRTDLGETDAMRLFVTKDVNSVDVVVPWAYQTIKYHSQLQTHPLRLGDMLAEAAELVIDLLSRVYTFRVANLSQYGLQKEPVNEHGILDSRYEGLPVIWNSPAHTCDNLRKLYDAVVVEVMDLSALPPDQRPARYDRLVQSCPKLVDISMKATEEQLRWAAVQDDAEAQLHGEQLRVAQDAYEEKTLLAIADEMEQPDEAMNIARRYYYLKTLAYILVQEMARARARARLVDIGGQSIAASKRYTELQHRLDFLYASHNHQWASALYEKYIELKQLSSMLHQSPEYKDYLTTFLHSRPEYAKMAWIEDIILDNATDRAATTLLDLGMDCEQDLWSQKIQLSLGKLSLLAGKEEAYEEDSLDLAHGQRLHDAHAKLAIAGVQDQAFEYLQPTIAAALDESAELSLCKETYGNPLLEKMPALRSVYEDGLQCILQHEVMDPLLLIDVLTMLHQNTLPDSEPRLAHRQFYLALKVAQNMQAAEDERASTNRIIWRRCLLRDDWGSLNDTATKDDRSVEARLKETILYETIKACLQDRIFDQASSQPVEPHSILGTGTKELDRRFRDLDSSIRDRIVKDMKAEDKLLKPLIETCRLAHWQNAALEAARREVEEEFHPVTLAASSRAPEKLDLERRMLELEERERETTADLLHARPLGLRRKPGGRAKGQASSLWGGAR